jgi:hypothetical protein
MDQQPQPQPQVITPHRPHTHIVPTPARPRRHRPVNPHAAANALALQHQDIAERVAANISRRTGHPREDLHQIAMLGTSRPLAATHRSVDRFGPMPAPMPTARCITTSATRVF